MKYVESFLKSTSYRVVKIQQCKKLLCYSSSIVDVLIKILNACRRSKQTEKCWACSVEEFMQNYVLWDPESNRCAFHYISKNKGFFKDSL